MDEFEAIKTQMEARRSSLAEKLEALENQVADSVQGVTSAVSNAKEVVQDTVDSVKDSVESVKDSMQETMGSVKEAFDFERQFDNHPWLLMGGALVLGFAAGQALPDMPATGRSSRSNGRTPSPYGNGSHRAEGLAGTTSTPATAGVMSAASAGETGRITPVTAATGAPMIAAFSSAAVQRAFRRLDTND